MVYRFFDKKSSGVDVDPELNISFQRNFIGRLLKSSRDKEFIHRLGTIYLGCSFS